jgi:DNA (cytosine-5)-methyltransferase 1
MSPNSLTQLSTVLTSDKPSPKTRRLKKQGINNAMVSRPTVIDLFAGAGGFSLAAQQSGARILGAVEFDKWAQKTYKRNFIENSTEEKPPRLYGDIWDIEPNDLLRDCGIEAKELDLLVGGPPCQGFSSHRINDAGVDDPRNELLLRYFDFVNGLQPKAFLVENVSGMLWKRHSEYVEKFKNLAKSNGYQIISDEPQIVNARDFGVPQNRKRVFILGVRSDISTPGDFQWPPSPTHAEPESPAVKSGEKTPWVTASSVFKKPSSKIDPNNIHMQPGGAMRERFKNTPLNGGSRSESGFTLPCHAIHKGHKDVYGRIDPSKPGPTMTTGCINPSKGRFVHPTLHHGITAREAAHFQTFPEDFMFEGGLGIVGKQIGNAVPITLGQHIIETVIKNILNYD